MALHAIDRQSPIFALVDATGRVGSVSAHTCALLGLEEDDLLGADGGRSEVHPADRAGAALALKTALAEPGVRLPLRLRARLETGPWHDLRLTVTNLLDEPTVQALVVAGDDVTERNRSIIAGHLETKLLDHLPAAVIVTDVSGVVAYWNRRAEELYGYRVQEALGRDVQDLCVGPPEPEAGEILEVIKRAGRWEGEYEVGRKDGSSIPVLITMEAIHVPEIGFRGLVGASLDNTERTRLQTTLAHQALHDSLTGLPNRDRFLGCVESALERASGTGGKVGVLFVDLDRFKQVNDACGHLVGDEILCSVGALFSGVIRPGDTIARLGGDEFAVCCEDIDGPADLIEVAERLASAVSHPFVLEGREFFVSLSVGIVVSDGGDGATPVTLLRDADAAMYHAKERGRSRWELFDAGMRADLLRRAEIAGDLRHAVARGELVLHYQPIVRLADGRLESFEALLRWRHPRLGLLAPAEFIDIAEETNLIVPIGSWALREACRQLAAWREELPEHPIGVSVNLSARQIADPSLLEVVRGALDDHDLHPSALCLEITESVLMDDAEASVATLRELKALGVRLAIDDFGTGYSSLAYLKRFPVDYLKIDRSFVDGIGRDPEDTVIVQAVIELARALGLAVVAEGVETEEQLGQLRRAGCDLAQGYWWSKPRLATDALELAECWAPPDDALAEVELAAGQSALMSTPELLAVLTHEMATPLTVVKGQCEILRDLLPSSPRVDQILDMLSRNANRIESLVVSLSDAQQLDAGALTIKPVALELRAFTELVVAACLESLPGRAIEVRGDHEVWVDADPARVEQIIVNLITNAAKFSGAETIIEVEVAAGAGELSVTVLDQGPGIPPERVADVFRKFARLQRSKKGVGLGLFLARSLARAHGGDLYYHHRNPKGSAFSLTLPVRRQDPNR